MLKLRAGKDLEIKNNIMKTNILTVAAVVAMLSFGSAVQAGEQTSLPIKVYLGGAYRSDTGRMDDSLRAGGLLPLKEPYTEMGYRFTTGAQKIVEESVFNVTGENAVIDWVVLEIRARKTGTPVVHSVAALIQADGDVVATDGISPVSVPFSGPNYYIALRHRNHLAVMTARPLTLKNGYDFTTMPAYGTEAVKVVDGVQVLWAGNANWNSNVSYVGTNNDKDVILTMVGEENPNNVVEGYFGSDTNMDGVVKYTGTSNERDVILGETLGGNPQKVRFEQMPKVK